MNEIAVGLTALGISNSVNVIPFPSCLVIAIVGLNLLIMLGHDFTFLITFQSRFKFHIWWKSSKMTSCHLIYFYCLLLFILHQSCAIRTLDGSIGPLKTIGAAADFDYLLNIADIVLTNLDQDPVQNARLMIEDPHEGRSIDEEEDDNNTRTLRYLDESNAEDFSKSIKCGFCKTNLTKGDSGQIQSPEYPDAYTPNVDCLWLLQTSSPEDRIVLDCDTIELGKYPSNVEPCN
jgi:hypothetical protein